MANNQFQSQLQNASSGNKKLSLFLSQLDEAQQMARKLEDIKNIASEIRHFSEQGDFKYRHVHLLIFLVVCALVALSAWLMGENNLIRRNDAELYWMASLGTGVLVFLVGFMRKRNHVNSVANRIMLKSVLIDNCLQVDDVDGKALWRSLKSSFPEFRRGDESQAITQLYAGYLEMPEGEQPFQLYEFHYVEVETRSYTEYDETSKTHQTREEEIRHTFYRYGILMDFPVSGFCLSGTGLKPFREKWTTTSRYLNKKLAMTAVSEMTLAKVLQPAVILMLEEKLLAFKKPSLHVTENGKLCFAANNSEILPKAPKINLNNTDQYLSTLLQDKTNKSLAQFKQILTQLAAVNPVHTVSSNIEH